MNITDEDGYYKPSGPSGPMPYGVGGMRGGRSKKKSNLRMLDVNGVARLAANRTSDVLVIPDQSNSP
jgi:hypothetical protein